MSGLFSRKQARFVLVVGDEGTMLASVNGADETAPFFAKARDEAARQAILVRLAQNSKVPVTILANNAAQEFRIDTLPPLNILDRAKLAQRRLRQAFPQAYAAASRMLDRTHVLLAGIHQGGASASWLGVLPPERVSLGLLPVESAGLVTQLMPDAKKGWAMLLAGFRTGGLRQIVTCDGQLVFTRQTQGLPTAATAEDVAGVLRRTIEDSRGYLARFGLTESADLRVTILLGKAHQAALRTHAGNERLTIISPRQAAEKLGLAPLPGEDSGDSDLVFAQWAVARSKLWLPLMTPAIKRMQQSATVAHTGLRMAAAVLVLALGMTGWDASQLAVRFYKNYRAAGEVADLRAQIAAQQAASAPDTQPLGRLRAALGRQRLFTEMQVEPWDVLRQLGQGLGRQARVANLDWRDNGTLRVDIRLDEGADAKLSDREAVVRSFKTLTERLAEAMPDYAVVVVRYPFPALPQESLTNIGGETPPAVVPTTAEFEVRRRL